VFWASTPPRKKGPLAAGGAGSPQLVLRLECWSGVYRSSDRPRQLRSIPLTTITRTARALFPFRTSAARGRRAVLAGRVDAYPRRSSSRRTFRGAVRGALGGDSGLRGPVASAGYKSPASRGAPRPGRVERTAHGAPKKAVGGGVVFADWSQHVQAGCRFLKKFIPRARQ